MTKYTIFFGNGYMEGKAFVWKGEAVDYMIAIAKARKALIERHPDVDPNSWSAWKIMIGHVTIERV